MSFGLRGWIERTGLFGVGALLSAAVLMGASPSAVQEQKATDHDELLKRMEKLLDDKLATVKEEIGRDVKGQIDANNKQILTTALTLQKTLKDSLGEVAYRAWSFEHAVKLMLLNTPLFDEHAPCLGVTWTAPTYGEDVRQSPNPPTIEKVNENSIPHRSGLRAGDAIRASALTQKRVYDARQNQFWVIESWRHQLPGEAVDVIVERSAEKLNLKVPLSCKKCGSSEVCPFKMDDPPKTKAEGKKELDK